MAKQQAHYRQTIETGKALKVRSAALNWLLTLERDPPLLLRTGLFFAEKKLRSLSERKAAVKGERMKCNDEACVHKPACKVGYLLSSLPLYGYL